MGLWNQAIDLRKQSITLDLPIIVVALRSIRHLECLESLKNSLVGLCRSIRTFTPSRGRIFIVNGVPNPWMAPVLGLCTREHNKLLFQAVTTINQKLGGVFYCDLEQHFIASTGEGIQPARSCFTSEGDLTPTGCFLYRSSLLREAGVVPYSLDAKHVRICEQQNQLQYI